MATLGSWCLREDGSLNENVATDAIIYHPTLNVVLIITKSNVVTVLDVNSGSVLQESTLTANHGGQIHAKYLQGQDKILFTNGSALGIRKDHNGVLLLDTILQTPLAKTEDLVKIELPLCEAMLLHECLVSIAGQQQVQSLENYPEVVDALGAQISNQERAAKSGSKHIKWTTVCLELPHESLKIVCNGLVLDLKRLARRVPAFSIASALNERLNCLLNPSNDNEVNGNGANGGLIPDRSLMFSEAARQGTFGKWPHMNYKWALPDQMAQAGFYHQPNTSGDDRAMCFTCNVCLVCWEPTDEPWSEHERHSPSCPFVKGEFTQNVPLSVTYATGPAMLHGERGEEIDCIGTTSCADLVPTATKGGVIIVWNVSKQLKKEVVVEIQLLQTLILDALLLNLEDSEIGNKQGLSLYSDLEVMAVSVIEGSPKAYTLALQVANQGGKPMSHPKPALIVGFTLRCLPDTKHSDDAKECDSPLVQALNDVNEATSMHEPMVLDIMKASEDQLEKNIPDTPQKEEGKEVPIGINVDYCIPYLLVYSINYCSATDDALMSKVSEQKIGSSGTRQESSDVYPDIFLSNFLQNGNMPNPDPNSDPFVGHVMTIDYLDDPDSLCPVDLVNNPNESFGLGALNDISMLPPLPPPLLSQLYAKSQSSPSSSLDQVQNGLTQPVKEVRAAGYILRQCVNISAVGGKNISVLSVIPTEDGNHIFVVVGPSNCDNKPVSKIGNASSSSVDSYISEKIVISQEVVFGLYLIYRLTSQNGSYMTLDTGPLLKREITDSSESFKSAMLLPGEVEELAVAGASEWSDGENPDPVGKLAIITYGGALQVMDLANLNVIAQIKSPMDSPFVSVTYCNSLERLCASTSTGCLHFFHLSSDFLDTSDELALATGEMLTTGSLGVSSDMDLSTGWLAAQPLTLAVLRDLHSLTLFENLVPCYSATVPPCWSEIMQAQQQRRHPQHLQGEDGQHTRSWRLQSDNNTWDDHLFEITLPKSCCVGHIDFKFTLSLGYTVTKCPAIQITLLQQNSTGMKQRTGKTIPEKSPDDSIEFGIPTTSDNSKGRKNPVTSEVFLTEHNAEILCGPIDISTCMDLTNMGGTVVLTSPQLINSKNRTFLIHLQSVAPKTSPLHDVPATSKAFSCVDEEKPSTHHSGKKLKCSNASKNKILKSVLGQLLNNHSSSIPPSRNSASHTSSSTSNNIESGISGCDCLHEISITIRKSKPVPSIPHERLQRKAMMSSMQFLKCLVESVCLEGPDCSLAAQNKALDILIWVVTLQLNGPRNVQSAEQSSMPVQKETLSLIQERLQELVLKCIIAGGRSIAHKCAKLLITCTESAENQYDVKMEFEEALSKALSHWLNDIHCAASAGALHWYFLLLNRVRHIDPVASGRVCLDLLYTLAEELHKRCNPFHLLLRARFGLYGLPLEAEIFELEVTPPPIKATSSPVTYASVLGYVGSTQPFWQTQGLPMSIGGNAASYTSGSSAKNTGMDFRDLLTGIGGGKVKVDGSLKLGRLSTTATQLQGLLEVEPLHFTCQASSEGTKLEKVESGLGVPASTQYIPPPQANYEGGSSVQYSLPKMSGVNSTADPCNWYESAVKKASMLSSALSKKMQHMYDLTASIKGMSSAFKPLSPNKESKPQLDSVQSLAQLSDSAHSLYVKKATKKTSSSGTMFPTIGVEDKKTDKENPDLSSLLSPWQQLVLMPPPQLLIIDRMHSGARRFVVLDFGSPVLLTDVCIPYCIDLASLSVDIWMEKEEDGQRLVVAQDIGTQTLLLSDLQPPPVCRYLKITVIGRYGMSAARCRIPIGSFYGHAVILPGEVDEKYDDLILTKSALQTHTAVLCALMEDISCRYNLACAKLKNLLTPLLSPEMNNLSHVFHYMQQTKNAYKASPEDRKILAAYHECITFQHQLNLILGVIQRIKGSYEKNESQEKLFLFQTLHQVSTDKLRVLCEKLLDQLHSLNSAERTAMLYHVGPNICEALFDFLCVGENPYLQLSAGTMFLRICGMETWWGQFLAERLLKLYSSKQMLIFPQDRVFHLLTYMSQRSLVGEQSTCVVENVLVILSYLLSPLVTDGIDESSGTFLKTCLDIPLISWVLIYLSLIVDALNKNSTPRSYPRSINVKKGAPATFDDSCSRWDFVQGEAAMNRWSNVASNVSSNSHRCNRRRWQKKLMMQHKPQSAMLDMDDSAVQLMKKELAAGQYKFPTIPSALKQHLMEPRGLHYKERRRQLHSAGKKAPEVKKDLDGEDEEKENIPWLNAHCCLPVIKGLVALIHSMDFTCNLDVFLIACKVIARLTLASRPVLSLAHVMSSGQLQNLLLLAVCTEQPRAAWGGPWASHAIICLLQDILECEHQDSVSEASSKVSASDSSTDVSIECDENFDTESSGQVDIKSPSASTSASDAIPNATSGKADSPMDSDSSDGESYVEIIIEGIMERKKSVKKPPINSRKSASFWANLATSIDARLEYGIEGTVENYLRLNSLLDSDVLTQVVGTPLQATTDESPGLPRVPSPLNASRLSSNEMLGTCFNEVFNHLHMPNSSVRLELVLQLWLSLNSASSPGDIPIGKAPAFTLSLSAISGLMQALAWHHGISLSTWALSFQVLTSLSCARVSLLHGGVEDGEDTSLYMGSLIISNSNFQPMLIRFFSGNGLDMSHDRTRRLAGPNLCEQLEILLMRLHISCSYEANAYPTGTIDQLLQILLHLLYQLIMPSGPIAEQKGPLDAQCVLVKFLLRQNFLTVDKGSIMGIIEAVGLISYMYILNADQVSCQSNDGCASTTVTATNISTMRGNFIPSASSEEKERKNSSWSNLICKLLKLVTLLVEIPLVIKTPSVKVKNMKLEESDDSSGPDRSCNSSNGSNTGSPVQSRQTDEGKAEWKGASDGDSKFISSYFADTVLKHQPTMLRLLSALAGCTCTRSTVTIGYPCRLGEDSTPRTNLKTDTDVGLNLARLSASSQLQSVGDAVFQLLLCLQKLSSSVKLVLQSILYYLSANCSTSFGRPGGVMQFSDPLLWFVMKAISTPRDVEEFHKLGGLRVICNYLVRSTQSLVSTHSGLSSLVMHHLCSGEQGPLSFLHTRKLDEDTVDGLLNFAPLGNISSSNLNAQPADGLIQVVPPHRRARTAAWSFHFYNDETSVDLTITLPCAVLLHEVQIQPHLTSLSTCPSAVSVEVSRDRSSLPVPVCPPLNCSGFTFIRMCLPKPEVVTSVLLRIYKPHDASNVGLSQLRLIGSTVFGDRDKEFVSSGTSCSSIGLLENTNNERIAKTSLCWLRLLHLCLNVAHPASPLKLNLLNEICTVPNLLTSCCGLLLLPPPSPNPSIASCLEEILLQLGLHSKELGVQVIGTLLKNGWASFGQGSLPPEAYGHGSSFTMADSVVELLFKLCTDSSEWTKQRLEAMILWIVEKANIIVNNSKKDEDHCQSSYVLPEPTCVQCVAAVLWKVHEENIITSLDSIVDKQFLRLMYDWSKVLPCDSSLKHAIDNVICSACFIVPDHFELLLKLTGVYDDLSDANIPPQPKREDVYSNASDDSKMVTSSYILKNVQDIKLEESQLLTVARGCQSVPAIKILIESHFPASLIHEIIDFCDNVIQYSASNKIPFVQSFNTGLHQNSTDSRKESFIINLRGDEVDNDSLTTDAPEAEYVIPILTGRKLVSVLKFLAEACSEAIMRDWLGTQDGSSFWLPLLTALGSDDANIALKRSEYKSMSRIYFPEDLLSAIEDATILFLRQCCWCHPSNQRLFASILCEVINKQKPLLQDAAFLHGLSSFTRRLILQLLLENERALVHVKLQFPLSLPASIIAGKDVGGSIGVPSVVGRHPRFGVGNSHHVFYLTTTTTMDDIVKKLTGVKVPCALCYKEELHIKEFEKDLLQSAEQYAHSSNYGKSIFESKDISAEDKHKGPTIWGKLSQSTKPENYISTKNEDSTLLVPYKLISEDCGGNISLPSNATLSQLFVMMDLSGAFPSSQVRLMLVQATEYIATSDDDAVSCYTPLPSILQSFTSIGGLVLLASHLPMVYPETIRHMSSTPVPQRSGAGAIAMDSKIQSTGTIHGNAPSTSIPDGIDGDWVKVDPPDEIYDEFDEIPPPASTSGPSGNAKSIFQVPSVPPHSLAAFGLFLRLPGYAELLLKDRKRAQCLLRLALGVTDDGEGGDIFSDPVAPTLPTIPFQVLRDLFDYVPLTTDDGVLLRRTTLDVGAMHLLLSCLAIFTHQSTQLPFPGMQHELVLAATKATSLSGDNHSKSDDKSHVYWAKGTGFGTGSTAQSWDVEQALLRQKSEEEYVTVLMQVLASYIRPHARFGDRDSYSTISYSKIKHVKTIETEGDVTDEMEAEDEDADVDFSQPVLPDTVYDLLQKSCLLAAMSAYLRNDSVMDMARHIPLYKALLRLLRALALSPQLVGLLLPCEKKGSSAPDDLPLICLLTNMKECVDTYASRLKPSKKRTNEKNKPNEVLEQDEGLAKLIPNIQGTALIVQMATDQLVLEDDDDAREGGSKRSLMEELYRPTRKTLEERYLEVVKTLQFDTWEMIVENDEGGYMFTVSHNFESNMRAAGDRCIPTRMKRLAQETVTLSTSLPLSYSSSVFVRCDIDRLDIMKVLITGPSDTPYGNGCFEFDVYFPPDYPQSPMMIKLETTGHHAVRFNPNLYSDGKVCLSVLNTWHGRPEEKWNPQTSSFLQVLVSIQSLILVSEPYFNEPGYERSRGTPSGNQSSCEYNSNIRQATVRWAMLEQIRNPCPCFKEVIQKHFWFKRVEITRQIDGWIQELQIQATAKRSGRTISLNTMALKRHFGQLKEEFDKMKCPPGLEDIEDLYQPGTPEGSSGATSDATTPSANDSSPKKTFANDELLELSDYATAEMPDFDDDVPFDLDKEMEKIVSKVCD